jgi:hypothetical protein
MKNFFSKYFSGQGLCLTHVWAPCCETWLKFEKMKFEFIVKKKCFANYKEKFWVWVTPLVGRHVVNELKIAEDVGRHVVSKLKIS